LLFKKRNRDHDMEERQRKVTRTRGRIHNGEIVYIGLKEQKERGYSHEKHRCL
jgi:hypothetical protein